jgi:hypothetical protein
MLEKKTPTPAILTGETDVSKSFLYNDIELFVSKAIDEDAENKHFLVCSMKTIPEFNLHHIQYPIPFKTEEERDAMFTQFDATLFLENLIAYIKAQKEEQEKNEVLLMPTFSLEQKTTPDE